jgi:hypothetical protein
MPADLVSTAATVWTLVAVAGLGIAALPWSDREVRAAARSFAAVPAVVGAWLNAPPRGRAGARRAAWALQA